MCKPLTVNAFKQISLKKQREHAVIHGIPQQDGSLLTKSNTKYYKAFFDLSKINIITPYFTINLGPFKFLIKKLDNGYYGCTIKLEITPFFILSFSFGINPYNLSELIYIDFKLVITNFIIVLLLSTYVPFIKYIFPLRCPSSTFSNFYHLFYRLFN
jgi:hypothetical protein